MFVSFNKFFGLWFSSNFFVFLCISYGSWAWSRRNFIFAICNLKSQYPWMITLNGKLLASFNHVWVVPSDGFGTYSKIGVLGSTQKIYVFLPIFDNKICYFPECGWHSTHSNHLLNPNTQVSPQKPICLVYSRILTRYPDCCPITT